MAYSSHIFNDREKNRQQIQNTCVSYREGTLGRIGVNIYERGSYTEKCNFTSYIFQICSISC